jgi:hypothetical protein
VQPKANKGLLSGSALRLGSFALVMRKDEVGPAAVKIKRITSKE